MTSPSNGIINPIFTNALFFPSGQLVQSFDNTNNATASGSNNVNGGPTSGNVFQGQGSDFLDPEHILNTINDFSNSVTPVTTSTSLLPQLINPNGMSVNDNPIDINNMTVDQLSQLASPDFGLGIQTGANSNPFTWVDPSALDIQLGTLFTSASLQTGQNFIPSVTNANISDVLNALNATNNPLAAISGFPNPDISNITIGGIPITGFGVRGLSNFANSANQLASSVDSLPNVNSDAFAGFG